MEMERLKEELDEPIFGSISGVRGDFSRGARILLSPPSLGSTPLSYGSL